MPLTINVHYGLFNHLGSYRNIIQVQINCRREVGKQIPESSRLEFLEKFSANYFALSDAEDNTSGLLNRGGIANLPMLRTRLAIHQKSRQPKFRASDELFSFISIVSLAGSRTLLQQLLAFLNFRQIRKIYPFDASKKVISENHGDQ